MPRGAKPGERRGGRAKGVPNRKTAETVAAIEASGLTPLEYLLGVMRDDMGDPVRRLDAAKAAAPYVHARLSTIDVGNKGDEPFEQVIRWACTESEATPDPSKK